MSKFVFFDANRTLNKYDPIFRNLNFIFFRLAYKSHKRTNNGEMKKKEEKKKKPKQREKSRCRRRVKRSQRESGRKMMKRRKKTKIVRIML